MNQAAVRSIMHFALLALLCQAAPALTPSTAPADPATDWLLNQPAPASRPADVGSPPASPFNAAAANGPNGTVELSDGTKFIGPLATTPGKPLRFWVEEDKRYVDVDLNELASMSAEVVWERDEAEWQYAASGQDQKVYSGKTYPARETAYHVTLKNGDTFLGSIMAPLNVTTAAGEKGFILHKRDKGDVGTAVAKLVYVKTVTVAK